jgi:hypothetical protein
LEFPVDLYCPYTTFSTTQEYDMFWLIMNNVQHTWLMALPESVVSQVSVWLRLDLVQQIL